jgi:hypothetical protein
MLEPDKPGTVVPHGAMIPDETPFVSLCHDSRLLPASWLIPSIFIGVGLPRLVFTSLKADVDCLAVQPLTTMTGEAVPLRKRWHQPRT